jgi:diguanylate cyclase
VKIKLLVVDDDPMAARLITDVAVASGYDVIKAANGKEGVALAASQTPDLILMDIMMPEMDGYTAISHLKGNPKTARIPVIMLTAVGFDLNRHMAMNMGAADYIIKPFDIKELVEKIGKHTAGLGTNK